MSAVLLLGLPVALVMLLMLAVLVRPLLTQWLAERQQRALYEERLLAQARIDALTRLTVMAMRAELRRAQRRER